MSSNEILHVLARMYHRISGFAHTLNEKYGMEWVLVLLSVLAIILFLMREKPLTNLLLWLIRVSGRGLKRFWAWAKKAFSRLRFKPLSPALKTLAKNLDDLSAGAFGRYDRPHYMVLSTDTNVQRMLEAASDIDGEAFSLEDSRIDKDSQKNWYIFNKGCVFHFPDPLAVYTELQQIRPERPMDGIILCLPASLFLSQDPKLIQDKAEKLYSQLWEMQKKFHFVLPVYLLISDCDQSVEGFSSFWGAHCLRNSREEIFGWSNPYEKFKPFDSDWISEGMDGLLKQLRRIQLNIVCDKSVDADLELLLYPSRMGQLTPGIVTFCQTIFADSSFHEAFMFRGFYFSGDVQADIGHTVPGANNPNNTEPQTQSEPQVDSAPTPWFLRDLLYKRIFAEANLGFAPQQQVFSSVKRLRVYQYGMIGLFIALSAWLFVDQRQLEQQSNNLTASILNLPTRPAESASGAQIRYVEQILEHISDMDASALRYGSIFMSYTSNVEEKLNLFFAEEIFERIIFPALECQAQNNIQNNLESVPEKGDVAAWMRNLSDSFGLQDELHNLMVSTHNFTNKQVEQKFSYLVKQLFNQKLPSSFYTRSDVYISAIRNHSYVPIDNSRGPVDQPNCNIKSFTDEDTWAEIELKALELVDNIATQVKAPASFYAQLNQLQSLPLDSRWDSLKVDFSQRLNHYLQWSNRLQENWLKSADHQNSCESMLQSMQFLSRRILGYDEEFVQLVYNQCEQNIDSQLAADNDLLNPSLYQFDAEGQTSFSNEAKLILDSVQPLTGLSFIQVVNGNSDETRVPAGRDGLFFWSVEHLHQALRMVDEYKMFAQERFSLGDIPGKRHQHDHQYLAQSIALKQLQLAMSRATTLARQYDPEQHFPDQYKPVSQQEAKLISYISNFKKARPLLLKLHQAYSELGLRESQSQLDNISNYHAFKLLDMVDRLERESQLYMPMSVPMWGAHQYLRSMFGIAGKGQLQDYLAAESDRMGYLATEYAEPLLTFLSSTKAVSINYALFTRWKNTLVEYNKKFQHKDSNNSLDELESFFENQLLITDQSNCFKQSKTFASPQANNLYAEANRQIILAATHLCDSYRKDKIEQEYAELSRHFTRLLAGNYPFTRSGLSPNATPQAIREFLAVYPGKSSGLAKRMENLVWVKRNHSSQQNYRNAHEFISRLDQSLAFFASTLAATQAGSNGGLEVNIEFDALAEQSRQTQHLGNWTWQLGTESALYPNSENNLSQSLLWAPLEEVSLTLEWAQNSPFRPQAIGGTTRGNRLTYQSEGLWSLLHFVQNNRSATIDTHNVTQGSVLLNFSASLFSEQQADNQITPMLAYARLTVLGQDVDNKKPTVISIPLQFPDYAPSLGDKP